ncbi:hypothetical protein HY638_04465 [Candidatus Woesearchaeota archaeon]|nr:hypothetical protein [Candidatus Woesearchaeota archaeon]
MVKLSPYILVLVLLAVPSLSYDYIVVGEHAAASDIFAASNLATALNSKPAGRFYPNLGITAMGDAYQFRETGNMLEGSENISHVKDVITSKELYALRNGTFSSDSGDFVYTQKVLLREGGYGTFDYATDIPTDDDSIPRSYFVFPSGQKLYKYILSFPKPLRAKSDANNSYRLNIMDNEISLMGKRFRIIDAEHPAKDHLKLTLLEEEKHATISEGESISFEINSSVYNVSLLALDDANRQAKFIINGKWSSSIPKGGTYSVDTSLYLHVKEIIQNEASDGRDFAEIVLSSRKIVLEDANISNSSAVNSVWYVNGEKISDTDAQIVGTDQGLVDNGETIISDIEASFTPRDTYFVSEKQKLSDILLDRESIFLKGFDFLFLGSAYAANPLEAIVLNPMGKYQYNLDLQNKNGDFLQIPLFYADHGQGTASDDFERFGDSNNDLVVEESRQISQNDYFIVTSDSYEGQTAARGITHLFRYKGQNNISKTLRFEDVATGVKLESSYINTTSYINLDSERYLVNVTTGNKNGNISVDLNNDKSIDSGDEALIVTMFGSVIKLDTTFYDRLEFTTKDLEFGIFSHLLEVYVPYGSTLAYDTMRISVGNESHGYADIVDLERCLSGNPVSQAAILDAVCYPTFTSTLKFMLKYGNLNLYIGTDEYGSYITHYKNTADPDNASIYTTQQQLETVLFLTAGEVGIANGIQKGNVSVITDSASLGMNASFISVGGPCANKLTAKVMGIEAGCEIKFGNRSIVRDYYYTTVIAGFTAEQTKEAAEEFEG